MGNFRIIFIFSVMFLLFGGCVRKIPLSEEQKVYQGEWLSESGNVLIIDYAGTGYLKYESEGVSVTVKYGSVTITNGQLSISFLGIGKTFSIDEEPAETGNGWSMTLDGIEFTKR